MHGTGLAVLHELVGVVVRDLPQQRVVRGHCLRELRAVLTLVGEEVAAGHAHHTLAAHVVGGARRAAEDRDCDE